MQSNASEPLLRCRKKLGDVKTEDGWIPRDQFGRYLFTARMASGMKAAGTWYRLLCGTWETVAPMSREKRKRRPRKRWSTDAEHRGGLPSSSDEVSVMEVERRGVTCLKLLIGQPEMGGTSE